MKFYTVPKWATYIALDYDRKWYAYKNRPSLEKGEWIYRGKREEVFPVLLDSLKPITK